MARAFLGEMTTVASIEQSRVWVPLKRMVALTVLVAIAALRRTSAVASVGLGAETPMSWVTALEKATLRRKTGAVAKGRAAFAEMKVAVSMARTARIRVGAVLRVLAERRVAVKAVLLARWATATPRRVWVGVSSKMSVA